MSSTIKQGLIVGVLSALIGAAFGHFLVAKGDKSVPDVSIIRVARSLGAARRELTTWVSFPEALADEYNANPSLPGEIDASKEIPLAAYSVELDKMLRSTRVALSQERHHDEVLVRLFESLTNCDHRSFVDNWAKESEFLWSYIEGAIRRRDPRLRIPTFTPLDWQPPDFLTVAEDTDGDYVVSRKGSTAGILLYWSRNRERDKEDARATASSLAKAIALLDDKALHIYLNFLKGEVSQYVKRDEAFMKAVEQERGRFETLEVVALVHNRGKRTFCVSPYAALFVKTKGYTLAGSKKAIPEDARISVRTFSRLADGEVDLDSTPIPELEEQLIQLAPGEAKLVTFIGTESLSERRDAAVLEALATNGERTCYIGVRVYSERSVAGYEYSRDALFRVDPAEPDIPPLE